MERFVFNDETKKNSHGFYLVNAGGRFERFNENPVMLNNHDLAQLIGKWLDLKMEDSLLTAEPEFDEGDPDALKIKGKVERGYLRGASPGIIILAAEWRENPATGEQDVYVTDWELFEASTVSVPSNAGALTLRIYDNNHRLVQDTDVKGYVENIIRLGLSSKTNENITKHVKMNTEMKLTAEALVALGIQETAEAAAVSAAIIALKVKADNAEKRVLELTEKAEADRKKAAEDMVGLAIQEGRITADKKEAFVRLALADPETTKATLEAIPAKQSLAAKITGVSGTSAIPEERKNWTLLQWMKNDMAGLKQLQKEEPEMYEAIKRKV
ncbi:MAG: HK97 family phage prohead protease [Oscillibacter sp.]|nr:HK97 family phage prohead protease [Oscillibacter sp.]